MAGCRWCGGDLEDLTFNKEDFKIIQETMVYAVCPACEGGPAASYVYMGATCTRGWVRRIWMMYPKPVERAVEAGSADSGRK